MLRAPLVLGTLAAAGALAFAAARPAPVQDMQEMPQPTRFHKLLQRDVGQWEGTMTTFVPGMPSEPVPATQTVDAIGGFWTRTHFECPFMGMKYIGTGVIGYDAEKEKFVGNWVDSMSSYFAMMEGELSDDGKTLTMRWDAPDMTGAMTPHRYEATNDGESYTSTFYMGAGEAETKSMVIEMKKVSGKAVEAGTGR